MARKLVTVMILFLVLVLAAGCAAPGGGGSQATPAPGGGGSQNPPSGQGSGVTIPPGPVVTVPEIYAVEIQENRNHNPIHPDITVTFRGGKGQYILRKIAVTFALSNGQVIQKTITPTGGDQYSVGDYVTVQGTTGVDRVIVVVTILGKEYKILDMLDDYNSRP